MSLVQVAPLLALPAKGLLSLAACARDAGVTLAELRGAAAVLCEGPTLFVWGLGLSELVQGVASVMALANLALLTGSIGRPGAGVLPLRGQNNVQGNADMGCMPGQLTGYQAVDDPDVRERVGRIWGGLPRTLPRPEFLEGALRFGSLVFPTYRIALIVAGLVVAMLIWLLFERTQVGAIVRAGVDDEEMVRGIGIGLARMEQGLGRNAAHIEAGAAVGGALLHHRDLHAELRRADGAHIAAGAGPDNDEIVLSHDFNVLLLPLPLWERSAAEPLVAKRPGEG